MKVIPAIDLRDGQCVRLLHGDFDRCTKYDKNPIDQARYYEQLGFSELHVVDLDGALTGNQLNQRMIAKLCAATELQVQLGGGIRNSESLSGWLSMGVSRCVVGSVAVTDFNEVRSWIENFGADQIVLAFDVRITSGEPRPAIDGWTRDTGQSLWNFVSDYVAIGARHVLCTDIARDGAMTGPSLPLYDEFVSRYPDVALQASGGVRSVKDLEALHAARASAAIVGRALLDEAMNEEELLSFLRVA